MGSGSTQGAIPHGVVWQTPSPCCAPGSRQKDLLILPRHGLVLVQPLPTGSGTSSVLAPGSVSTVLLFFPGYLRSETKSRSGGHRQMLRALVCHSRAKEEP